MAVPIIPLEIAAANPISKTVQKHISPKWKSNVTKENQHIAQIHRMVTLRLYLNVELY